MDPDARTVLQLFGEYVLNMGGVASAVAAFLPEIVAAIAESVAAAGAAILEGAETAGLISSEVVEFSAFNEGAAFSTETGLLGTFEAFDADVEELELEEYLFGYEDAGGAGPSGFTDVTLQEETSFFEAGYDRNADLLLPSAEGAATSLIGDQEVIYSLTSAGAALLGFTVSGIIIGGSVGIVLSAINSRPPRGSQPPKKEVTLLTKSACLIERNDRRCKQMHSRNTTSRKMRVQRGGSRKRQVLSNVQNSGVRRQGLRNVHQKSTAASRRKVASAPKRMRRKGR